MDSIATSNGANVSDITKLERIGAHSHVIGLGLNAQLECLPETNDNYNRCGLIGQAQARQALGLILKLCEEGNLSGRGVLIVGPPGTGKTAIALALAKELGSNIPFYSISATELYSMELSQTEMLTQAIRSSMGIVIEEEQEVLIGEVVEIQMDVTATGKKHGRLTLCTTDMETIYDLGTKFMDMIAKERISAGDVIQIDKSSGNITKLGRSMSRSRDYDAMGQSTKFVSCPEGELQQRKVVSHTVTLHEMDVINSRQQGFLALFAGDTGEISDTIRDQINSKIAEWQQEGRAKIIPGVLFIDEVHMLDIQSFSFLNRALEQELAPIVILATNRGMSTIRGTNNYQSPHGIPYDFLDRLVIIRTQHYTTNELLSILKVRCQEEDVEMEDDALELLTRIAKQTSLRYAIHTIVPSCIVAQKRSKSKKVQLSHVETCFNLFVDVQRSTQLVMEYQHDYMFNELTTTTAAATTSNSSNIEENKKESTTTATTSTTTTMEDADGTKQSSENVATKSDKEADDAMDVQND